MLRGVNPGTTHLTLWLDQGQAQPTVRTLLVSVRAEQKAPVSREARSPSRRRVRRRSSRPLRRLRKSRHDRQPRW